MLLYLTISIYLINKLGRILKVASCFVNVLITEPANTLLIKKTSKHPFGKETEWTSTVFGNNQKADTLTILGQFFRVLIDSVAFLPTFKWNHCLKQT